MTSRAIALALASLIATSPAYAQVGTSTRSVPRALPGCYRELRDTIVGYEALIEGHKVDCRKREALLRVEVDKLRAQLAVRTATVVATLVPDPEPPPEVDHSGDLWLGIAIGGGAVALIGAVIAVSLAASGVLKAGP